ncbi:MAG: PIN domain-containing protein [Gammaproteobacteria bacterium]|nr:PIN domain-containing protein [Gammaproteobacteria bacterium]
MNRHFLDTNVVIYAYSNTEIEKSNRANELLFNDHSIISTQVVNEFSNVCLRKFRQPEQTIIKTLLELARTTTIANFSLATQLEALIKLCDAHCFSYYDALIVATAMENECAILYCESS